MAGDTPSRTEIEALSWLFSRKIWASTIVMMSVFVVLVGVTGVVLYGAPLERGLRQSVENPVAVLYIFLFSRAFAFAFAQARRDAEVEAGELSVAQESSLMGMVTVAAFSLIGVLAAGVAMPLLVTANTNFTYLAAGIAVFVVPTSVPLLVYQLGQRAAADRHRRGYHVFPAAWHYLLTFPAILLAWYFLANVGPIPVTGPLARPFDVQTVFVDAWTFSYVAIWTPVFLAFLYPVRWYAERVLRFLSPV